MLQEEGVYQEDFDTYSHKDYVEDAEWNIWASLLGVASIGDAHQLSPSIAGDGSGNVVVVWREYRNGDYDIYAQCLDSAGNRLWAADLRVNADDTAWQSSPSVAVDGSGNAVVVWHDDRNGN
jgi:hypothetical protein